MVDEKRTRVGHGIGVVGEDFDALLLGFAEGGGDPLLVFRGDGDDVYAECDPVFHNLVLFGGIGIRGAVKEELDAELLRGFIGARFAGDEVGVALGFGEHRDDEFGIGGRRMDERGQQHGAGGAKTQEGFFHGESEG